jgi:chaperonin cofactor prefoldin
MREKIGVTEREMIDWLGAEDQSAEFLDLELEKIRAERRQAEKELEKLKDKLKDDKGK